MNVNTSPDLGGPHSAAKDAIFSPDMATLATWRSILVSSGHFDWL